MPEPVPGSEWTPGLHWAVRPSFFRYVAALPDGRASTTDGATMTLTDPQVVHFVPDPDETDGRVLAFRGDLRLSGHNGFLFVRLADPRIHLGATEAEPASLTVDDPVTEDGTGSRLPLVTLTMTRTDRGWTGDDVRLTADGVGLFNHVYTEGEAFERLTVEV